MANLKSLGTKGILLRMFVALALCISLFLVAQGKQGKGNKGKGPNCKTITADAEFRDETGDGIRSDGLYSVHGDKRYYGLEDTLVCLLTDQDHDFIQSTQGGTSYEKESGVDRKVTLDFTASIENDLTLLPFQPYQIIDPLIRADEILSDTDYTDLPKRLLLWFDVGRDKYQLRFDGIDCDLVWATQSGESPNRIWTIESFGDELARLVKLKGLKKNTIGYFKMPFKITVYETAKPPTCL